MHAVRPATPHRLALLFVTLSACAQGPLRADPDAGGAAEPDGGGDPGDAGPGDPFGDTVVEAVYAHSATDLYSVDPDDFAVTRVGAFGWPGEDEEMTDLALDQDGRMMGISFTRLFEVDRDTAACTFVADLDREFNGLSFLPAAAGGEQLVGAAVDGTLWSLDPATGRSSALGSFGDGLGSSGDLVSITGLGTFATASSFDSFTDLLVRVDPANGAATVIGDTGVSGIWGLGFWGNRFYGFTSDGDFVLIDPQSGATRVQESADVSWYGAGVTTIAPVLE